MKISMTSRNEIARSKRKAYQRASKKEKTRIISDVVSITGWTRDHAARRLKESERHKAIGKRRGRKPIYGMDHKRILLMVWVIMDYACSKRLKAGMPDLLNSLISNGHLTLDPKFRKEVEHMAHGTMDRLLQHDREAAVGRGRSTTKPGSLLKHQIPIRRGTEWDDTKTGFLEIDLVAHCGDSTRGDYALTLDTTDIHSGWTECYAVLNKAQIHTFNAMKAIRERLPFPLLGIDSDNGSEFINAHFFHYCQQENLVFTRGRPNTSNDSCHIEQKNWSVVRQTIGYARFQAPEAVDILNQIYLNLRLINNFFMPSVKLVSKTRDGSRITKVYDKPLTPYRRLLSSNTLSPEQRKTLKDTFLKLDPYALRQSIVQLTRKLQEYVVPYV